MYGALLVSTYCHFDCKLQISSPPALRAVHYPHPLSPTFIHNISSPPSLVCRRVLSSRGGKRANASAAGQLAGPLTPMKISRTKQHSHRQSVITNGCGLHLDIWRVRRSTMYGVQQVECVWLVELETLRGAWNEWLRFQRGEDDREEALRCRLSGVRVERVRSPVRILWVLNTVSCTE